MDTFTVEVVPTGPVDGRVNVIPGTILADALSADAIDGKTITGVTMNTATLNGVTVNGVQITGTSTVTGATVQTAASGARVVMNGSNLRAIGTNGSVIGVDPNATYPYVYWSSVDGTNKAVINVSGGASDANIGINSGDFADGAARYKWRTYFGGDFYTAERVDTSTLTPLGGRLFMNKNTASLSSGPGGGSLNLAAGTASLTAADIRAAGTLRADNISIGIASVVPTPNVPTAITLSGGSIAGNLFRGFVTANSSKPGTEVTGVGCTGVSSDGMTIWVTRTNNTSTSVFWEIRGEL
jgi:hypothetical protein